MPCEKRLGGIASSSSSLISCRLFFTPTIKGDGPDLKKKKINGSTDAFALFPDLLEGTSKAERPAAEKPELPPPPPPDISWLKTGQQSIARKTTDAPAALVLMSDPQTRKLVSKVLEDLGYQTEFIREPLKAIEKIQFSNIAMLVQHTDFEAGELADSIFYNYLKRLPMKKRRYIFYMLAGPCFHTLYDLEALSNSANLVVNDRDLKYLKVILKKSFHDFENLFSNFIDTLDGAATV